MSSDLGLVSWDGVLVGGVLVVYATGFIEGYIHGYMWRWKPSRHIYIYTYVLHTSI